MAWGVWGGNLAVIGARGRDLGIAIETIVTDEAGRIDVGRLQDRIDDDVRLVAVAAMSSINGLRQPAGSPRRPGNGCAARAGRRSPCCRTPRSDG